MKKSWKTPLIHSDAQAPEGFRALNTPVYRASTVLFDESPKRPAYGARLVRLYTGLEAIEDVKADVEQALGTIGR